MRHATKGCTCDRCERRRAQIRAWARSEKGRAYHRAYKRTESYIAGQKAWEESPAGRASLAARKARYNASERGRQKAREGEAVRRLLDHEKLSARKAVAKAKATGKLVPPERCSACGEAGPLEAHHHRGYGREHRLDVLFVCPPCHRRLETTP